MKKSNKILLASLLFILIVIVTHLIMGYGYIFKGITFAYLRGQKGPGINEHHLFYNYELQNPRPKLWNDISPNKSLSANDITFLDSIQTASFLVIKNGEIVHESYYNGFNDTTPTNSFSAVKSMVSLCIGIAIDEGYIGSVDQKVAEFLPEFKKSELGEVTIRHLLTMSSGLSWSESGNNPYSNNAAAYYGSNLRALVTSQRLVSESGKVFDYKSGDTQLLSYIVEEATGQSLGDYFYDKIWSKIDIEHKGYWNLDKKDGDEKGFCCLYATPRDYAKLAQLVLNNGQWNGVQIISKEYLNKCLFPAKEITEKDGSENNRYCWQWWYANKDGKDIHYGRGLLGQYYIIIPADDLIIVRTGWKRKKLGEDGHPKDFWDYINIAYSLTQ
jgi:CubicO group peptidase (beta-lactamase class C family)